MLYTSYTAVAIAASLVRERPQRSLLYISRFTTVAYLKSVRGRKGSGYWRLAFLIKDLKYNDDDPRSNGVLITNDFDLNLGTYYYLVDNYDRYRYDLVFDRTYDMAGETSKHRTFVGILHSKRSLVEELLELRVPAYETKMVHEKERPFLDEEEMTDENFSAAYGDARKGERDSQRELDKLERLELLKEEYKDRLPAGLPNHVTHEYNQKVQEIEDEYLDSLELPIPLEESRLMGDEEFLDSFESLSPEEESSIHQAQVVNDNWAHEAMADAVRDKYIRPGEEFHAFAIGHAPSDPPSQAEDEEDPPPQDSEPPSPMDDSDSSSSSSSGASQPPDSGPLSPMDDSDSSSSGESRLERSENRERYGGSNQRMNLPPTQPRLLVLTDFTTVTEPAGLSLPTPNV